MVWEVVACLSQQSNAQSCAEVEPEAHGAVLTGALAVEGHFDLADQQKMDEEAEKAIQVAMLGPLLHLLC